MPYIFTARVAGIGGRSTRVAEWFELTDADTADYIVIPDLADITVQVLEETSGTPTVTFEGSLNAPADATKAWFPLTNAQGAALSFTAPGGSEALQSPVLLRPQVATGGATIRVKAVGH